MGTVCMYLCLIILEYHVIVFITTTTCITYIWESIQYFRLELFTSNKRKFVVALKYDTSALVKKKYYEYGKSLSLALVRSTLY